MRRSTVSTLTRRSLLRSGLAGAGAAAATGFPLSQAFARTRVALPSTPWALGVASGDPSPDGVVLWTRLATDALGVERIGPDRVRVRWEVAEDEGFRKVMRTGATVADRQAAHSVHVELDGLRPHREYWYRFAVGTAASLDISPVGRTRTAPAFGASPDALRFAFASCQHLEAGYYTAWRDVARQDLDLVLHLGDYIYEGGPGAPTQPRQHVGREITSLFDYRRRLAQYRSDPDLRAAHAAHPFVIIWDDHEVDNNYAGLVSQDDDPEDAFATRRAAAYRAYYEHMPLRRRSRNRGPNLLLDRTLPYGDLAQFTMLDTRQYRADQACGDGNKEPCAGWDDPGRTFLGADQERRVLRDLERSGARWNVIGNQIPLTAIDQQAGPGQKLYMDGWAGYPVARDRFLQGLTDRRVRNPLVVTGDVHASWACQVNRDVRDPASTPVAVELIGTSITSGGDGTTDAPSPVLPENPQVKFQQSRRGYVHVELTRAQATAEFRHLPYVSRPDAPIGVAARFTVPDGRPELRPA
jgi:alkaline phosphatase D